MKQLKIIYEKQNNLKKTKLCLRKKLKKMLEK